MPAGHANPEKRRPLSSFSKDALRQMLSGPVATHKLNPGVTNKLYREGLADYVVGCADMCITDAGRAAIALTELPRSFGDSAYGPGDYSGR